MRDGNIGGILSMTNADGTFTYHYDGSGNVVALTDANQNIVAQYSYDAFGNTLSASGAQAEKNPFRFSSKYYDGDTGLYDYGYRHYDSSLGRWINRDPIGESGGLNLYGMVGNNPINDWDEYGLAGRGNRKGERSKTGKRSGTPNPNKGLRELNPPKPNKVFDPKANNGKGKEIARPPGMPFPKPSVAVPLPPPPPSTSPLPTAGDVGKGIAVVGGGYIAYRCLRMVPSLFPPLWPSIPANVAIP